VHIAFKTPEEKKEVFALAKRGEKPYVDFLRKSYSLKVWTEQELCALNLLIVNRVENEITSPYIKALERAAEQWRTLDDGARAKVGETRKVDKVA